MASPLWPLCRLTLIITFFWMFLATIAMIDESQGARLLHLNSPTVSITSSEGNQGNCPVYIEEYERKHRIPSGLLLAISKVESGRKDLTGHIVSWPWTVNAEGQGFYFPTKEAAISAVRKMQQRGISSIDVGCMQVNLYHHPHAFKDLNEAFDPQMNVAYAARFLSKLKLSHASWHQAVAHYHSANPLYNIPYRKNVLNAWNNKQNKGEPSLNALIEATERSPKRLYRVHSGKRLSLVSASLSSDSSQYVRRTVVDHSKHIRRSSFEKKTLKL